MDNDHPFHIPRPLSYQREISRNRPSCRRFFLVGGPGINFEFQKTYRVSSPLLLSITNKSTTIQSNDRLQISFSVSDVFDTSEWQARLNTGSYRLANYSKEATHAYWIGLTFNFNNFKSRPSADDSHPQKRQVIQLGQ